MNFFYMFVFVVFIAISYVIYAMYKLPQLGENDNAHNTIMIAPLTYIS